jgi:hypothetical protein
MPHDDSTDRAQRLVTEVAGGETRAQIKQRMVEDHARPSTFTA